MKRLVIQNSKLSFAFKVDKPLKRSLTTREKRFLGQIFSEECVSTAVV